MCNHVHYLLAPEQPEDLPKLMHWLNCYSAMCFNQLLNRTGHFWEERYFSVAIAQDDTERILKVLRYIHANPKAAGIRLGMTYAFSNYGSCARLTDDGLTEWHPAFLALGSTLTVPRPIAIFVSAICRSERKRLPQFFREAVF